MSKDTRSLEAASALEQKQARIRQEKVLIVGAGIVGLVTAKTFLDDGWSNLDMVTSADEVGGVWAMGESGGIYPGLLTNSGHGDFEASAMPMPAEDDLDKTEGRIRGETVARYMGEYYRRFVEPRLKCRFSCKVVEMTPSAIGRGYQVVLEDQTDRRRDSMHYDRVVLCQGPFNNPRIPECLFAKPFHGPIVHSYHLHSKMHERVLEAGPRVVVVGLGKSSIDIAALYTQLGKRVTIVFDRAKFFNAPSKEADHRMTTRRIATMFPAEQLTTWVEWLLHKTRLGAWWLRRSLREGSERQRRALGIDERSPLYRNDIDIIWRGPDVNGGRSSGLPNNFHQLVRDGRIDCKPGCRPAEITDDGRGVILTDGSRVDADAIVCGTGFKSSFDFIPLEHRIQLGIEPVAPDPRLDAQRRHRLDGYLSLRDPPAAPTSGKASHVYKGLIPVGAFDRRDLACNGFFHLLGSPFTGEIAAHWILDFFLEDPSLALRLPADQGGAWDAAESHANWVRARYQARDTSFETNKVLPLHNHHQYNDGLLSDMRLSTAREAKPRGWFGWGYYTQPVKPSSINNLREERMERDRRRRQRRENDGSRTMFDWLSEWLRGDL